MERAGMGKNVNHKNEAYGLPSSETSIARMLKDDGYATAVFGKWHLGYTPEFSPFSHGFDEFFGILDWTVDYHSHKDFQGKPALFEGTEMVERKGYLTDLITERSVSFIEKNKSRPFFLYVAYNAVLPPYQRPDRPDDIRGSGTWTRGTREDYAQMVERVDYGVGRILDTLAKQGLDKDTLVIFNSDHGGEELSRNEPFFHHFSTLWEGGIRVPCILSWPGRLPEGEVSDQAAMTMDLTVSILSAAGTRPPEERRLDGIDLLPILKGDKPVIERTLFWRMDYPFRRQKAVRRGKWKYLQDSNIEFLFDLEQDPGERHNLASRFPDVFRELKTLVKDWESEMERSFASRKKTNDIIRN
jgi:arylsulfatase A-like enzyme